MTIAFESLARRADRIDLARWIPSADTPRSPAVPSTDLEVRLAPSGAPIELTDWSLLGPSGFVKRPDGLAALAGWGPERESGQ